MEKKQHPVYLAVRAAFPHTIPVLTGYLVLGVAYGVLMQTKGYGTPWVLLMCCLAYCGSMQFVAITLLTTVFDPIQAFLMSLMVNARHLFYGVSMLDRYRSTGRKKPYLIFALSDETFSVTCSTDVPEDVDRGWFYFFVTLLDQLYWFCGAALGALGGMLIRFNTQGLDFSMTALFVVIFINQWRKDKQHISALAGLGLSVLSLLFFGAENFLLPAMAAILLALALMQKPIEARIRRRGGADA